MRSFNTTENSVVDIAKLFFAICVVGIHTHAFNDYGIENIVTRLVFSFSVPFFFVASGFFLARKMISATSLYKYRSLGFRYVKKLFKLYIIWGSLNFVLQCLVDVYNTGTGIKDVLMNRIYSWIVSSPGGGMWYVQAILILTLILMISNKKAYRYILLILLFIVFIIRNVQYNTFFDGLNIIFDDIFRGDLNFLSKGIYFISGFCLYDMYSFWQLNSKNKRILIGALALGYFFEVLNIRYDFMLASILHLLMAIGLFIICYNTHSCLDGNKLLEFRKESTVIYFTHVIVKYGVQFIFIYFYRENETLIWLVTVVLLIIWSKFLLHTEHGMKLYKLLY